MARVLAISDELGVYTELDDMLRHAVELARQRLKLERVSIFVHDEKSGLMRGTFGTGARGETTDERWHAHPVTRDHKGKSLGPIVKALREWGLKHTA